MVLRKLNCQTRTIQNHKVRKTLTPRTHTRITITETYGMFQLMLEREIGGQRGTSRIKKTQAKKIKRWTKQRRYYVNMSY